LQALGRRAKRAAELTPDRGCRLFGRKNPPEKPLQMATNEWRGSATPARYTREGVTKITRAVGSGGFPSRAPRQGPSWGFAAHP
jgi:hypothetical protein